MASYGGMLSFELQYTLLSDDAHSYFDADVELIVSIASLSTYASRCIFKYNVAAADAADADDVDGGDDIACYHNKKYK